MLSIMDRPMVSAKTFYQHKSYATVRHGGSSASAKKILRSGSSHSIRSDTPTSGKGFSTLNAQARKKKAFEISNQNLSLVNTLLAVQPTVPLAADLNRFNRKQDNIRRNLQMIRYGSPKPIQGVSVKMRLSN